MEKIAFLFYVCGVPMVGLDCYSCLFFGFSLFFFSLQGACENASMFCGCVNLPIVDQNRFFFIRNATKHKNESDTVAVM